MWGTLAALAGVLLAGLVAIPGCLNPRPEEDPSALELAEPAGDGNVSEDDAAPQPDVEREACDDNPLLAGCQPSSPAPGGSVDSPAPSEESPAEPADAGVPDANDAGSVDAGAAASPGSPLAE